VCEKLDLKLLELDEHAERKLVRYHPVIVRSVILSDCESESELVEKLTIANPKVIIAEYFKITDRMIDARYLWLFSRYFCMHATFFALVSISMQKVKIAM